jgi:t-SNARE complex subunit (syntaxin)
MTQPLLDQDQLDGVSETLNVLEQQVNQIIQQMRQIHDIFHQTLTEIQAQRHFVTTIDGETSKAVDAMERGNEQLDQAAEKQKTSTRCLCVIVTIVILVVIGVVLVILYETVWHKS